MDQLFDRLRAALEGRYALEREIGAGGMATVYLARDLRHRRPVALKVVRPELGGPLGGDRFLRETELAARLVPMPQGVPPDPFPPSDDAVAEGDTVATLAQMRAGLAEAFGLTNWDKADPELGSRVGEAREALQRLTGEPAP